MPSKFEKTDTIKLPLGASKAYVALYKQNGHSVKAAPFVGKPYSMKPDRCQVNAEYKEGEETQDWVTGPLPRQLFNLRWNTLRSSYAASASPRFPTLPPQSAADITDLRIDMPASDGNDNTADPLDQPTAPAVTFVVLKNLLLVGFGRRLHLLPFHWGTSCPVLVDLRLEGVHTMGDVQEILRGCPALEALTVSTIMRRGRVTFENIKHSSLIELTLVSNISVAPMLKGLELPDLATFHLWTMPDVACKMTDAIAPLVKSTEKFAQGNPWEFGLNLDMPLDTIGELEGKKITYIRLR
ncbi:hypothetical protein BDN72DRAFT_613219 [Pluteus cervinus]|uniref:Uncharacterized protein n=1 Tax=Pluteus cervinus TaxID=181527 RepID=A0ACD3A196_9AGAR|nr:hypothetical protein BDN72DRAFT_613219 [Pluteus cervinus]